MFSSICMQSVLALLTQSTSESRHPKVWVAERSLHLRFTLCWLARLPHQSFDCFFRAQVEGELMTSIPLPLLIWQQCRHDFEKECFMSQSKKEIEEKK